MKPVYIINGFLDSGKTSFINYTLSQPYFRIRGTTLLILCEEGDEEYDKALIKENRVVKVLIENEEDLNPAKLLELDKQYKPERVIIEFNGMWNFKNFKMPMPWALEQQITMIDASTFVSYYTNMRSLLAEMLRKSELIIFNRCDGIKELSNFKRNVKAVNPGAEIVFEDKNGEVNEIMEEELPYDLKADIVELDSRGFGIWYLDSMDHPERYEGKTLRFTGQVMKHKDFRKNVFVPGRMAMTCCAEDMAFLGYLCEYDGAEALKDKDWVEVTAKVVSKTAPEYQNGSGPVLEAIEVKKTEKPENDVIDFNA